jgi:hypothetical protein
MMRALILTALLLPLPLFASEQGMYVGWTACSKCHESLAESWQVTRHAKAFKSLAKDGKQDVRGCITCHVTGYEKEGGFIDDQLTPEMTNVQCEACHGPGKKHADDQNKSSIIAQPGIDDCRKCHTPGQDAKFDYSKKKIYVHPRKTGQKTGGPQ